MEKKNVVEDEKHVDWMGEEVTVADEEHVDWMGKRKRRMLINEPKRRGRGRGACRWDRANEERHAGRRIHQAKRRHER